MLKAIKEYSQQIQDHMDNGRYGQALAVSQLQAKALETLYYDQECGYGPSFCSTTIY